MISESTTFGSITEPPSVTEPPPVAEEPDDGLNGPFAVGRYSREFSGVRPRRRRRHLLGRIARVDIDPGDKTTWEETVTLAKLYRTAFDTLGVRAYPKLTGKRGIQAWIPIVSGKYSYSDTSAWVEKVSRAVGQMVPDLVSWEWAKASRKGRARLDYTQNASIKTLVAPYAVRPAAGPPVELRPSVTTTPPAAATTGLPNPIASAATSPNPSRSHGVTTTAARSSSRL